MQVGSMLKYFKEINIMPEINWTIFEQIKLYTCCPWIEVEGDMQTVNKYAMFGYSDKNMFTLMGLFKMNYVKFSEPVLLVKGTTL